MFKLHKSTHHTSSVGVCYKTNDCQIFNITICHFQNLPNECLRFPVSDFLFSALNSRYMVGFIYLNLVIFLFHSEKEYTIWEPSLDCDFNQIFFCSFDFSSIYWDILFEAAFRVQNSDWKGKFPIVFSHIRMSPFLECHLRQMPA